MIRISVIFVIFILISFTSLKSKTENFIVAKVGQKIITNFEIKNKIIGTLIISGEEINQVNINSLKKNTLESLILIRLKEIELESFNFKVDNQRVKNFLDRLSRNNTEKLKKNFNEYNLNFNLLEKEIETELKWKQFIYQKYSNKNIIDENSINNEIDKILNSNSKNSKEVNLSEIVIFNSTEKSNKESLSKILQEIDINGFENTALKFSISDSSIDKGYLGWINISSLSNNIRSIVEKLQVNQVSAPIVEANNILILKLNDIRGIKNNIDREKLKQNLILEKQNEIFRLYSNSHLSKLRKNNLIQYK